MNSQMKTSLILIVSLFSLSCFGHSQAHDLFSDSLVVTKKNAQYNLILTNDKKGLICSLYRKFEKINETDSVTNFLFKKGKFVKEIEDGTYTTIMEIDSTKNALRIEDTETNNSSFYVKEYRISNSKGNLLKFIHSEYLGTNAFTSQEKFEIYDYDFKTNTFKFDSASIKLFTCDVKDFFYKTTPDSIIETYSRHSSNFFQIVYNDFGVATYILDDHLTAARQERNKWIIGNTIKFDLINNRFIRSRPYYTN
jgi:hypothetical protein